MNLFAVHASLLLREEEWKQSGAVLHKMHTNRAMK